MRLDEVESPLREVVKHGNLHRMEEVGRSEVADNTTNVSKHVESLVNMLQREVSFGCLGVDMAERSI